MKVRGFVKGLCSVCSLLSVGWLSEGDGVPPWSPVRDGDGDQTTTTSWLLVLPLGRSLVLGRPLVVPLSQLSASTGGLGSWSPVGCWSPGSSSWPSGFRPPGSGPPSGGSPASS